MFITIKIYLNIILIFLFLKFKLNFLLKLIELFGGTIFCKLFQVFNNLNTIKDNYKLDGTIGKIEKEGGLIKKSLHKNINYKLNESLIILEEILKKINVNYPFYYQEFRDLNLNQIDMNLENNYSKKLTKIFKNINNVKIINIIYSCDSYHISEFIDGYNINNFLKIESNKKYKTEIINLLQLSYYLMLSNNLFHCDWHFGNFLVNLDENNKIILYILDTGLMGQLNIEHYNKIKILLITNLLYPLPINIIKFLASINLNNNADVKLFIKESKDIIDTKVNYFDVLDNSNVDYQNIIINILKLSTKHNLKFPIIILFMFQAIIFLNNIKEGNDSMNNLIKYSKDNNFNIEIKNILKQ